MTKYNDLKTCSNRANKRVGRGIAAGQGKTAGRGTKGQKARTGKKLRATFAGGSHTLVRAIPKARGFKSLRVPAQNIYLTSLNQFNGKSVDNFTLFEAGLIASPYQAVKLIATGELTAKVNLHITKASRGAIALIEEAGGTFSKTTVPLKQSEKTKNTK